MQKPTLKKSKSVLIFTRAALDFMRSALVFTSTALIFASCLQSQNNYFFAYFAVYVIFFRNFVPVNINL